ncbi:hypothetical protein CTRI78_v004865 [Colletotrichum trifolii]|uniref:Uncharacterized protein n=1 Tax=Colletotrichum trifolii TaxID=5466 RepID=A0A4V3HWE2_COLTR|nr:hypothetical protein CTRI78_v004865 [Colletotrichum trifolii]
MRGYPYGTVAKKMTQYETGGIVTGGDFRSTSASAKESTPSRPASRRDWFHRRVAPSTWDIACMLPAWAYSAQRQ